MDNKKIILDNATKLFAEKGYDAVGIQELVDSAGITKPTLYYYFGNKEGLLKEIYQNNFSILNDELAVSVIYNPHPSSYFDDIFPVLVKIALAYFQFAHLHENFYRMVLSLQFMPPASQAAVSSRQYFHIQYELIEQMFCHMSAVHTNMRDNEKRLAWTFMGILNTYIGLMFNNNLELDKPTAEKAIKQFMHGIFS